MYKYNKKINLEGTFMQGLSFYENPNCVCKFCVSAI